MLIFFLFCGHLSIAQTGDEYLSMANKVYDAGDKEHAKLLYEKAAALNNPEAHYQLTYRYIVTHAERICHNSQAAKMGHSKATSDLLEGLFFRSASLSLTNPELAYEIYTEAKKVNPNLDIYDEEGRVATIRECIEAGRLDVDQFVRKYNITDKDTSGSDYAIWELAAEASHYGRFGCPDPKLVLQLVCRGGFVPAEVESAVGFAYQNWKDSTIARFDPCDYVTSGIGLAYCSEIASRKAEKEYSGMIQKLALQLKNHAGSMLKPAYNVAGHFIEQKAFLEEGSDGTGYIAWANESADTQKAEFIDLVKKVNNGYKPKLDAPKDYDKELNEVYKKIIAGLKQKPISTGFREITDHNIVMVQRAWIKYRDSSAKLFAKTGVLTERQWKDYLTKVRIDQLRDIEKLR